MAKITLKGIIKEVGTPERVGNNGTVMQSIVVFKKGFVDEYGTQQQPNEEWQIDIFNKKIEEFGICQNYVDKKVEVEFYCASRRVEGRDGRKDWFSVSNRLAKITVTGEAHKPAQSKAPEQMPEEYYDLANQEAAQSDDLPF